VDDECGGDGIPIPFDEGLEEEQVEGQEQGEWRNDDDDDDDDEERVQN